MARHLINGLVVDSGVTIFGAAEAGDEPADITVTVADSREVPTNLATGRLMQAVAWHGELQYSTVERDDGSVLLRLHGLVDFHVDPDRRHVLAWPDPACGPEMLGILVSGNLIATVLALRGETVLHASAVEIDGRAVAFVAHSGVGKSTIAALACARGARLVTDDLLRLRHGDDGVFTCWPGIPEIRLRDEIEGLVDAARCRRTSTDGRLIWRPRVTSEAAPPLVAVVLPQLASAQIAPKLQRLTAGEAIVELTRRPRILGWTDLGVRAEMFASLSRLVRSVPVWDAVVPCGPPFDAAAVERVLDSVGLYLSGRPRPAA